MLTLPLIGMASRAVGPASGRFFPPRPPPPHTLLSLRTGAISYRHALTGGHAATSVILSARRRWPPTWLTPLRALVVVC